MPVEVEGELARIQREIESLVGEALVRFRVGGMPRVEGGKILLVGDGPTVAVELGALSEQWPALAPGLRRTRARELARRLAEERRAFLPARGFLEIVHLPGFFAPLMIVGVAAGLIYFGFRWLGPPSDRSGRTKADAGVEDSEAARRAREARVCEAALDRVNRGTPIAPSDAEGWVIELTLLGAGDGRDLFDDPALFAFVERMPGQSAGRFRWTGAPELAAIHGVDTAVRLSRADLGDPLKPALRGVSLTFSGRYVELYFREEQRLAYLRTAGALAARLNPRYAALYARCSHLTSHHLGAWFLGVGPNGAATSVVYFMGTYAGVSHVSSELMRVTDAGGIDRAHALGEIAKAAAPLDRDHVLDLIGKHGGMIAGRPDSAMTISFPFKDGNRAVRASHDIARSLKIAEER